MLCANTASEIAAIWARLHENIRQQQPFPILKHWTCWRAISRRTRSAETSSVIPFSAHFSRAKKSSKIRRWWKQKRIHKAPRNIKITWRSYFHYVPCCSRRAGVLYIFSQVKAKPSPCAWNYKEENLHSDVTWNNNSTTIPPKIKMGW